VTRETPRAGARGSPPSAPAPRTVRAPLGRAAGVSPRTIRSPTLTGIWRELGLAACSARILDLIDPLRRLSHAAPTVALGPARPVATTQRRRPAPMPAPAPTGSLRPSIRTCTPSVVSKTASSPRRTSRWRSPFSVGFFQLSRGGGSAGGARGTTEPHCVGLKDFPSLSSSTPSQGLSYPIEPSGLSGCFSGDTTGRTTSAGL
jgi:hypothetical protein